MKRLVLILLIFSLFFTACTPAAQAAWLPAADAVTWTPPSPSTRVFSQTATAIISSTPSASAIAQPVQATITLTPAPIYSPTTVPTLSPIRFTPPTLMLHRPNLNFDSLAFLKDFIKILKLNNMQVVTYRHIHDHPDVTAIDKGKLFIITIDDIFLPYPIDKRVLEMIKVLREAGYPAVLGVVTETDYVDPKNAVLLKELSDAGWEIASHTDTHLNLGQAEKTSSRLVYNEITLSMDKIEKVTGVRPITLVLPEGQMVNNMELIKKTKVYWIVGIGDGNTYDVRDSIIYVGREGPYKNAGRTFKLMKDRFGF